MEKYMRKEYYEALQRMTHPPASDIEDQNATQTISVNMVERDTKLESIYGPILVVAGNYIATDHDGNKFGISPLDLSTQYVKLD